MGLGKTLQAIGISCFYSKEWPILIAGPCSLHNNWKKELSTWIDIEWAKNLIDPNGSMTEYPDNIEPYITIIKSSDHLKKVIEEGEKQKSLIYIISYDLIAKNNENETPTANWLRKFSVVIGDESHMLKNDVSNRTQSIFPILKDSKRTILISGTASPSRPIELFTQMKALFSGIQKKASLSFKKTDFGSRYCDLKISFFTTADYRGNRLLTELNLLLSRSIMIRRLKRDVLSQLPPKKRFLTYLNLAEEDIGPQRLTFENFANRKGKKLQFDDLEVLQKYNLTAISKRRAVGNYARGMMRTGEKFIIFAHHRTIMDTIEEEIKSEIEEMAKKGGKKFEYVRIDGETPIEQRHEMSQQFRENDNIKVAILSISVAGVGLNFVPCSNVVFAELTWNSGTLLQAEDRAHRIGQNSTVNIHYLVARNTLDEYIWDLLGNKIDVVSETLNGERETEVEHHITKGSQVVSE